MSPFGNTQKRRIAARVACALLTAVGLLSGALLLRGPSTARSPTRKPRSASEKAAQAGAHAAQTLGRAAAALGSPPGPNGPDAPLERRVAGLTGEQLMNTLLTGADGERVADHERFLWRASGYLQLHPERTSELTGAFLDQHASRARRALVLDLLVAARNAQAQSVLRSLLASSVAHADPDYGSLLQRLAFVEKPEPETVAFAQSAVHDELGDRKLAASYALGSVAGHLARNGDRAGSERLGDELARALDSAASARTKTHLLGALANLKTDAFHAVFARYARDEDPLLRGAVASSLGETHTAATLALLLSLAEDQDAQVRSNALRSIGDWKLPRAALQTLADLAVRRGYERHAADLLRIASRHAAQQPDLARAIAAALSGRADAESDAESAGLIATLDAQRRLGVPLIAGE